MDDSLAGSLAPFDAAVLAGESATVYSVDEALRIRFVNPAWDAFARENGAAWPANGQIWGVGSNVLAAISESLRPFYDGLFADARRTREPMEHEYECPSPERSMRYRMRILPCGKHDLLVVHSLVYSAPHPGEPHAPSDDRYRNASGLVVQCSHCRRARRCDASAPAWDWVPAYVARNPPRTSHGLCEICEAYYFPSV